MGIYWLWQTLFGDEGQKQRRFVLNFHYFFFFFYKIVYDFWGKNQTGKKYKQLKVNVLFPPLHFYS